MVWDVAVLRNDDNETQFVLDVVNDWIKLHLVNQLITRCRVHFCFKTVNNRLLSVVMFDDIATGRRSGCNMKYRKVSNIRRTKSQNLNASRLVTWCRHLNFHVWVLLNMPVYSCNILHDIRQISLYLIPFNYRVWSLECDKYHYIMIQLGWWKNRRLWFVY